MPRSKPKPASPLLTPPPTRQQTPASPIVTLPLTSNEVHGGKLPIQDGGGVKQGFWEAVPRWRVVLLEVAVTLPLYLLAFWVMIEGIKAGGDTLINFIDYLAFRP